MRLSLLCLIALPAFSAESACYDLFHTSQYTSDIVVRMQLTCAGSACGYIYQQIQNRYSFDTLLTLQNYRANIYTARHNAEKATLEAGYAIGSAYYQRALDRETSTVFNIYQQDRAADNQYLREMGDIYASMVGSKLCVSGSAIRPRSPQQLAPSQAWWRLDGRVLK